MKSNLRKKWCGCFWNDKALFCKGTIKIHVEKLISMILA